LYQQVLYKMAEFKIENTKSQMRKGILEYCILATLKRKKEAYPSDIIGEMKEAKLIVVEGTLYPLLTRLKNSGVLAYQWEESTSGPPRKYYRLTELGDKVLKELDSTWLNLVKSVNKASNN
jgi:PadR family transcriptional regulator PadR